METDGKGKVAGTKWEKWKGNEKREESKIGKDEREGEGKK